ncbi:hypothetical protein L2E82_02826 [Cichorium intybus]|uniref:Uncharacterized protein n=1 Tax=Cichorium intybus TaxID=13427 RepID=A0ACB9H3T8_CICIN|nr:hypothetical protein L2E82_02826 [Cichorium intybus]
MLPAPRQPHQSPLTAAARCFRSVLEYFIKEVDDPTAERKADALLVAASVIAAMNYQAAISPPGGAYQDTKFFANGTKEYEAGQAIAAYVFPYEYKRFSIANTVSFTFSMTTMFLFLSGLSLKRRIFSLLLTVSTFITITATSYSYKMAMEATTPDHDGKKAGWIFINRLVTGALIMWCVIAGITIVVFVGILLKPWVTAAYHRATLKT